MCDTTQQKPEEYERESDELPRTDSVDRHKDSWFTENAMLRPYCSMVALMTALVLAGCSPVTALNVLAESEARSVIGIGYGDDSRQKLDVYIPTTQGEPYPVVLYFFGGSWNSGDRADYRFVGEALAARGVLVDIADYRLHPQVRYPDFLQDSAKTAAWTIANVPTYGGDATRIYVMGAS
jgi:acetyl esterase/lipase